MNQQLVCVVIQVPGEVSVQAGSGQRGQQDDPQQHRHRTRTQPAVDQDRGVMTLTHRHPASHMKTLCELLRNYPVVTTAGFCRRLRSLAEMAAATSVHVVAIVEPIIQHADWFFPEGEFWRCLQVTPTTLGTGLSGRKLWFAVVGIAAQVNRFVSQLHCISAGKFQKSLLHVSVMVHPAAH